MHVGGADADQVADKDDTGPPKEGYHVPGYNDPDKGPRRVPDRHR
jgi:hypothetical protein